MTKRNKELAAKFRNKSCINCGRGGSVGDHILAFGRCQKRDVEINLWPLCVKCHHYKTHNGLTKFVADNGLEGILLDKGFYFCKLSNKWRHKDLGK